MKAVEMRTMTENKVAELEQVLVTKAGNKNPDYYKTQKEYRLWMIIYGLLNDMGEGEIHINEDVQKYFTELSQGIKRPIVVEVHEGDNVLELLDKYNGVKDVYNKIKKACADAGLKIEGSSIVK